MKRILFGLLAAVTACTGHEQGSASVSNDSANAGQGTVAADSAALAAYEDSIVGKSTDLRPTTVTRNGDTLTGLGSWVMYDSLAGDYGLRAYIRNGVPYLRIARRIGRAKHGLIWDVRSRFRLPAMDSTDHIVLEGFCRVNGKDDPAVIAITGTAGDSLYWNAHHAWRFEAVTATLREIPAASVSCKHVAGEE
jgi:hypothetical protein